MDEGWTRWVLDQYGFEYARVAADEHSGRTRCATSIDVILLADDGGSAITGGGRGGGRGGGGGAGGGGGRGARRRSAGGVRAVDADRVKAIDEFVRAGGTLVCFNRSSNVAIDQLHLPVKNVVAGSRRKQFFVGGSRCSTCRSIRRSA